MDRLGHLFYWLKDTLRYYFLLKIYVKGIIYRYKQFQMINAFEGYLNGLSKTDYEILHNLNNKDFKWRYDYEQVTDNDLDFCLGFTFRIWKTYRHKKFYGISPITSLGGHTIEDKTLFIVVKVWIIQS